MTEEQMIDWIRHASYRELLQRWRFAEPGDPFFEGKAGAFYKSEFLAQQHIVGGTMAIQISKEVGWEKPTLQEQQA